MPHKDDFTKIGDRWYQYTPDQPVATLVGFLRNKRQSYRLVFGVKSCRKWDIGGEFLSADLYWSPKTDEIVLCLREDREGSIFQVATPESFYLAATRFIRGTGRVFHTKTRFPVRSDDNRWLYIDTGGGDYEGSRGVF